MEGHLELFSVRGTAKSKGAAEAEADADRLESSATAAAPPPPQTQTQNRHPNGASSSSSQPASSSGAQPAANGHPRHPPRRGSPAPYEPPLNGLSRLRLSDGAGGTGGQGQNNGDYAELLDADSVAVEQSPQARSQKFVSIQSSIVIPCLSV